MQHVFDTNFSFSIRSFPVFYLIPKFSPSYGLSIIHKIIPIYHLLSSTKTRIKFPISTVSPLHFEFRRTPIVRNGENTARDQFLSCRKEIWSTSFQYRSSTVENCTIFPLTSTDQERNSFRFESKPLTRFPP